MEQQFSNSINYFDTYFDEIGDKVTPYFIQKSNGKKRIKVNETIVNYEKGLPLNAEDRELAQKIRNGQYFLEQKSKYGHCKLCSSQFNDYTFSNISNKYKYWEIGLPTQPYTPFGLMIYLKNRATFHKSSILELSIDEVSELTILMQDIYNLIRNSDFNYEISGINIMFNQFTVSQACLHGHVELMLKDIDKLNLGCFLKPGIKENLTMKYIPKFGRNNSNGFYYVMTGDSYVDFSEILSLFNEIENYKTKMEVLIRNRGITSEDDYLNMFSPVPLANAFFTYYRNKIIFTIIPELYLEPIDIDNLIMNDFNLYCLKYNNNAVFDKYKFMYQCSPMIRPCIKLNKIDYDEEVYEVEEERLKKVLKNGCKNI